MQRLFDIVFSFVALLVLSPALIPIAVVLRLTGEGEVFYLQERIGKDGRIFKLFKFATMLKNSPSLGTGTVTIKSDPRVLPVGKVLRKTKLNELPQLLNILLGDMSLIGPRPLTAQTFNNYLLPTRVIIKKVRPGLSGVGSIIFRAEEDLLASESNSIEYYREVIAPYKGTLEEWYVENQSLYTYFLAIITTLWVVLVPNSSLPWKVFGDLPEPPGELKKSLGYPY